MPPVFLTSQSMQTITLVPTFFTGEFNDDQTKILASAVLTAIPEIVACSHRRRGQGFRVCLTGSSGFDQGKLGAMDNRGAPAALSAGNCSGPKVG
jgi:hypothetical protein